MTFGFIPTVMLPCDTNNILWVEKYRPKKLEDMTQNKYLLDLFRSSVKTKNIPHFLFYGPPGSGKTSAILAIGRELFKEYFSDRVIEFNASDDRGINAVREKITGEAKKYVTEVVSKDRTHIPPFKIIILDEADSMTEEAQDALRVIIEQYSSVTRFCFICNYIGKITSAIKSRCSIIYFKKLSNACMINKLKNIAIQERLELDENILNTVLDISNGDMRKAIMMLQNLKYLYLFKKSLHKPISKIPSKELEYLPTTFLGNKIGEKITESDVYQIATYFSLEKAAEILQRAMQMESIVQLSELSKEIIATGYPVDNILAQLNKEVLKSNKLTDKEKAMILIYSGDIFYKLKECSNEYIQLLNYLSCVSGIKFHNRVYSDLGGG